MVLTTVDLATPWSSRIAVEAQVDCLLASAAHKGASWQGSQNHCRLQKGQPRIVSDPLNTNSGRHALYTPVRRRQGILPAVLSQCLALMHGILRPVPASQVMPVAGVDVATPDGAAPLLKALQGQHVSYKPSACHQSAAMHAICKRRGQHGLHKNFVPVRPVTIYCTHEYLDCCST